jgi:hypothetical protein
MTSNEQEIRQLKYRLAKLEKYLLHTMRATGQISLMAGYSLEVKEVEKRHGNVSRKGNRGQN